MELQRLTPNKCSAFKCSAFNSSTFKQCEANSAPHPHKSTPYINLICLSSKNTPNYSVIDGEEFATYRATLCEKHQNLAKHAIEIIAPEMNDDILVCSQSKRISSRDIKNNPKLVSKTREIIEARKIEAQLEAKIEAEKAKFEAEQKVKIAKFEKYKKEIGFDLGDEPKKIDEFIELIDGYKRGNADSVYTVGKLSYEAYEQGNFLESNLLSQSKKSLDKVLAKVNGNPEREKKYAELYLYLGVVECKYKKYDDAKTLLDKYNQYEQHAVAQYYLGEIAFAKENFAKAKELLIPLAENGDDDSIKLLAKMGVKVKNKLEQAQELMNKNKLDEAIILLSELSGNGNQEATELLNEANFKLILELSLHDK
ncbi:MAG: hypothetical protein RLZZ210_381 [Pseudomonadota bacterium]|jgi:hypothetical protein